MYEALFMATHTLLLPQPVGNICRATSELVGFEVCAHLGLESLTLQRCFCCPDPNCGEDTFRSSSCEGRWRAKTQKAPDELTLTSFVIPQCPEAGLSFLKRG